MSAADPERLSRIETLWTVVRDACGGPDAGPPSAREALYRRYAAAVYRYLLGALRDENAAAEVFQEVWLRVLRGYFRNATPERGRFRALLKTSLFRLVMTYRTRQGPPRGLDDAELDAVAADTGPEERAFLESTRQEFLDRTWLALQREQDSTRQPLYAALRLRAEQPELSSQGLAEALGARLGRALTPEGVRQSLRRARERFAELLVDEVAGTLPEGMTVEDLEEEVAELGLLSYCQSALKKRKADGGAGGVIH